MSVNKTLANRHLLWHVTLIEYPFIILTLICIFEKSGVRLSIAFLYIPEKKQNNVN